MDEISNNSVSNKRILKNTLFLYCRMIIVLLVSLYATRVILNVLGVTDYGIYNVVAGFVSMFSFLNSAMNNTTQRYLNYERGRGDLNSLSNVFNTSCQIQAIIAVVTLLLLEVFGVWYINNIMIIPQERIIAANWVFQFSSLSLVLLILQIPYSADIISHERMDYYALISIIDVVVKLLIVIVLPCLSYDKLFVYGLLSFVLSLINFLLFYIYSNRNFVEVKLRFEFDRELFKTMLSFSGWNMLGAIAYTIQGQGLNVLVNSFFGPVVNAARAIAFQIHAAISGFSENSKPPIKYPYKKESL
jgi:O-antigen/teichoic acid export membrane protein